jgi:hypothetical protein
VRRGEESDVEPRRRGVTWWGGGVPAGVWSGAHRPATVDEQVVADAAAWRLLQSSPHVAFILAEWLEWDRRRREVADAHAVHAVWPGSGSSYAEIERRRWGTDADRYARERHEHAAHRRPVADCPLCLL